MAVAWQGAVGNVGRAGAWYPWRLALDSPPSRYLGPPFGSRSNACSRSVYATAANVVRPKPASAGRSSHCLPSLVAKIFTADAG